MSALIRYFLSLGKRVAGYDRTPSHLTRQLEDEGARLHYEENPSLIPDDCRDPQSTLVVYTPAVPSAHAELTWFAANGFELCKRAQVLGLIPCHSKGLCVAGTHGKTTTTTMTAHLLRQSHVDCTAFLGGISQNYGTNLLLSADSPYVVIEADEFDRSFHWLRPWASVVTATDPDHLDIYGTYEAYLDSFRHYTELVQPGGSLIVHTGLALHPAPQPGVRLYSYGRDEGDFHAANVRVADGEIRFDFVSPWGVVPDVQLGVPVSVNVENGVAALALASLAGLTPEEMRRGMASFRGVERRFDFKLRTPRHVLLSDYAHHPAEIARCLESLRELYPSRRLTVLFQPHLYSRTRDLYHEFAQALSLADEVVLTDIYPARELPIEGVSSRLIYDNLRPGAERVLCPRADVLRWLSAHPVDVLAVLGAGDIDNLVPDMHRLLAAVEEREGRP